jgi:hypothetical protein
VLRRAGRPLSAADLVDRLGGPSAAFLIACHLRQLRRLGVVLPTASAQAGRSALAQRYRLKEMPEE